MTKDYKGHLPGLECPKCRAVPRTITVTFRSGGSRTAYCDGCTGYIKNLSETEWQEFSDGLKREAEPKAKPEAAGEELVCTRADFAAMFALMGILASGRIGPLASHEELRAAVLQARALAEIAEEVR